MDVSMNCPGQHLAFDVAPQRHIVIRALRVSDTDNILLDDRAFVQVGGDKVRRGTNQFYAAIEGLFVRATALKDGRNE